MTYDEELEDRRERYQREEAAEAARLQREARIAVEKCAARPASSTAFSRRGFVGALAVAALAPRVLHAATPKVAPVSDADLLAILDRPIAAARHQQFYPTCYCSHCIAKRAQPFSCFLCGSTATPIVMPCTCDDQPITCTPGSGCCHADTACSVCGADSGQRSPDMFGVELDDNPELQAAAAMLRDLRAALRARGTNR